MARPEVVLARRRAERVELLRRAERFATSLQADRAVSALVVYGSVARGDFNLWSDVDVLVVTEDLPERLLDRLDLMAARPARVQAIAWTPSEWRKRLHRGDPIATEAAASGVWLVGRPGDLA